MKSPSCPLCNILLDETKTIESFGREFLSCHHCSLIFTSAQSLPDGISEKSRYENHENNIEDEGYVKFLNQAIEPALSYLNTSSRILDFGCGPQPVLSQLLQRMGHQCENYDPFFYPILPSGQFNIIFSTEVFEHFHHPDKELQRVTDLLAPDGLLVIMTEFYQDSEHFSKWWYTRDFTHVSFYNQDTFKYICKEFGYLLMYTDEKRVAILRKEKL
tara:strand:+ start:467 stop:1114 length:648 start_codon:yes stop_codon:yes gene_type:complete